MSDKIRWPWSTQGGCNLYRSSGDVGNRIVLPPQWWDSVSGGWSRAGTRWGIRIRQSVFYQIDLWFFRSFRMTMYLKWGIFSVQNGQILIVLLVKPLNWSASSKRKLPTVMDPWLYMTSKNHSFQFVLSFFCGRILSSHLEWKALKQGTEPAPNNSAAASVLAASTRETFLFYHTSMFFSIQSFWYSRWLLSGAQERK